MKQLGDITRINGRSIEPVDVITGGSPCQGLSIAGKRLGLADERSGLFMEQIRIIKEMREADAGNGRTGEFIRPRYMVWENVPGAFSSAKGEDFRIVLEETAKIKDKTAIIPRPPKGKWRNAGCIMGDGWSIAWRVFDAQFWGVPQRRRRIALVADFGGQSAAEILFEQEGLCRNITPGETEGESTAADIGRGIEVSNGRLCARFTGMQGGIKGSIVPTITADHESHITDYTAIVVDCRNLTLIKDVIGTLQSKDGGGYSLNYINPVLIYGFKAFGDYLQTDTGKALLANDDVTTCDLVKDNQFVRRLTPLECERLQGYPDGWTAIEGAADSPRYKALGNSIALPQWQWLLQRISQKYNDAPSLGSLFDGIGGFPLAWERINGKGTAIWASEIEAFPAKVTNERFGKK